MEMGLDVEVIMKAPSSLPALKLNVVERVRLKFPLESTKHGNFQETARWRLYLLMFRIHTRRHRFLDAEKEEQDKNLFNSCSE